MAGMPNAPRPARTQVHLHRASVHLGRGRRRWRHTAGNNRRRPARPALPYIFRSVLGWMRYDSKRFWMDVLCFMMFWGRCGMFQNTFWMDVRCFKVSWRASTMFQNVFGWMCYVSKCFGVDAVGFKTFLDRLCFKLFWGRCVMFQHIF